MVTFPSLVRAIEKSVGAVSDLEHYRYFRIWKTQEEMLEQNMSLW